MSKKIKFTEEQLDEMERRYRQGASAPELAEHFEVNYNTIYRRLRERNCKIRSGLRGETEFTDEQVEHMIREYRNGASSRDLAKEYGVNRHMILDCLREANCKIKHPGGQRINFSNREINKMAESYQQGTSTEELAKRFGVSDITILRRLKEVGCKIKKGGTSRNIPKPWMNKDTAYVFGVLIGDASMRGASVPTGIRLGTPDSEFVETFSDAVESAYGIQTNDHSDNEAPYVEACSVDLGRSYDQFRWRTETWRVPKQFFDTPREIKVALCQGKFDSDATVLEKAIIMTAVYKTGLEDIEEIVKGLDYKTTLRGPYKYNHKKRYTLRVCNASPNLFRLSRKKEVLRKSYLS